jgi:hypothetical protein
MIVKYTFFPITTSLLENSLLTRKFVKQSLKSEIWFKNCINEFAIILQNIGIGLEFICQLGGLTSWTCGRLPCHETIPSPIAESGKKF